MERYRVLRALGSGGMGVVYEAEQDHPRRRIALKVLRAELAATKDFSRFEQEAEILGRLKHPGIAHVYEAGTWASEEGDRPFIAMELVDGTPIDEAVRSRKLAVTEVLELMAQVSATVEHAHRHGVVHRDLKPANILVTETEEGLQTKVLDFGVARLIDPASRTTQGTDAAQVIGTVAYMSPEQIESAGTVDTRTDVYALGLVLYELLAGQRPFDLSGRSLIEAARIINQDEPPRLGRVDSRFRGDLETIVAKALEKRPDDRYASAGNLGGDLRRYLRFEPILAHPPSITYQLRKLARRRRGLVGGILTGAAAVILGLVVSGVGFVQARWERDAKVQALDREKSARRASEAVTDFLSDMIADARPETQGRDVTLRELLEAKEAEVRARFVDEPLVRARLHRTLARTFASLGDYARAEPHAEAAVALYTETVGLGDERTLQAGLDHAEALFLANRYDESQTKFHEVYETSRRAMGEGALMTLHALAQIGFIEIQLADYDSAEEKLVVVRERLQALHPDDESLLDVIGNLANLYSRAGRHDDAEPLFLEHIAACRRLRGADHQETLLAIANLAAQYRRTGRADRALPLLESVLKTQERVMGRLHGKALITRNNLAYALADLGRRDEAIRILREAYQETHRKLGEQDRNVLMFQRSLAHMLQAAGRLEEAEPLVAKTRTLHAAIYGASHPYSLRVHAMLLRLRLEQRRLDLALPLAEELGGYLAGDASLPEDQRVRYAETVEEARRQSATLQGTVHPNGDRAPEQSPSASPIRP